MENVTIDDTQSNGDLIKIFGNLSIVNILNSTFNKVTSYGSLIISNSLKSNIYIDNTIFSNNKNINKLKYGIITSYNNVDIIINNSILKNNLVKSRGGVICLIDTNNLSMYIKSSSFENNDSYNGGVIYIKEQRNINKSYTKTMEIFNSTFIGNQAKHFGGVFYIDDYLDSINIKKSKFEKNKAYAGGIFYFNQIMKITNNIYNEFDKDNSIIYGSVESHGDIFASKPYRINWLNKNKNLNKIIVKSGETYPLRFELVDYFDQNVIDKSKFYLNPSINIKEENIMTDNEIELYENSIILKGNSCHFENGYCELNGFKIYTIYPTFFDLKFNLEYNEHIQFEKDQLTVKIVACNDNEIVMHLKDDFYYCESPVCDNSCPVMNGTAICKKGVPENINTLSTNRCECLPGWDGEKCETKIYAEIKKSINYARAISSIVILILVIIMIYIYVFRKEIIIINTGFYKCELALLGIMFFFISFYFNPYENYTYCALKFFTKHNGILLTYAIFIIYISSGYRLGIKNDILRSVDISLFLKEKTVEELNLSESKQNIYQPQEQSFQIRRRLNKNILFVHSIVIEIIFIYFIIIISFLIGIFIFSKKETDDIQDSDGHWRYNCPLVSFDLIMNLIEFILISYLILLFLKQHNHTLTFKCVKYIGYSAFVWITVGPVANLISYISIYNRSNSYFLYNTIMNGIGYIVILILFIWEKIYYILRKNKYDYSQENYFSTLENKSCSIHHSYTCDCEQMKIQHHLVLEYINYYKISTQILSHSGGKIRYNKVDNTSQIKFII